MLALTIPERETIIRALDDPPPGIEKLRAVLLRDLLDRTRSPLDAFIHNATEAAEAER